MSGLGEVVKLHIMGGRVHGRRGSRARCPRCSAREPRPFCAPIRDSLGIKRSYIEGDEFDTGRRNLLNYGHCFGHAIESATDFARAARPGRRARHDARPTWWRAARGSSVRRPPSEDLLDRLLEPSLAPSGIPRRDGRRGGRRGDGPRQEARRSRAGGRDGSRTACEMAKSVDVTADEARAALARFAAEYPLGR